MTKKEAKGIALTSFCLMIRWGIKGEGIRRYLDSKSPRR